MDETIVLLSFGFGLVCALVGTVVSVRLARQEAADAKPEPKVWLIAATGATVLAWLFGCVVPPMIGRVRDLGELLFLACAVSGLLPFAASFPVVRPALAKADASFNAKVRVIFGLVVGAMLGVPVSQYAPIFGGFATMGRPWSQARMSLLGEHVLAFAIVGGGLGFLVTWAKSKQSAAAAPGISAVGTGLPTGDVSTRLAEVDRLLAAGAITKDEHASKRAEILRSL